MDRSVRIYIDDDPGFRAWRDEHDDGYIVNTERRLGPKHLILHTSRCPHLRHRNEARGEHTMTGSYTKVCSTSRDALER